MDNIRRMCELLFKTNQLQTKRYRCTVLVCASLLLTSCLGGDTTDTDTTTVTTSTSSSTTEIVSPFPKGIAVASPLSLSLNTSISRQNSGKTKSLNKADEGHAISSSGFPVSDYQAIITELNDLLDGSATISDTFRPGRFYLDVKDADCYGPEMAYQYHLNGTDIFPVSEDDDSASSDALAVLPAGELGIWEETNGPDDEVCIAAQLNARASGMKVRTQTALAGIASLMQQYQKSNPKAVLVEDLAVGTSVDLTDELNEQDITNSVITSAKITHSTANVWDYSVSLVFKTTYAIDITLTHSMFPSSDSSGSEATEDAFEGLLTYRIDDLNEDNLQCNTDEVAINGSAHYIKNTATDIRLQAREAEFCDHGTNGFSELVDSSVLTARAVDPSLIWDNNFQIFTAQFDPRDLTGSYSFGWQPARDDTLARYTNFTMKSVGSSQAFFGYGNTMQTYDGLVKFFSCNITGPGAMQAELEIAQSQTFALNPAVGVYQPSNSSASNILYAPTNSCLYNGDRTAGITMPLTLTPITDEYSNALDGSNIVIDVNLPVTIEGGVVGTTVEKIDVPDSDKKEGFTATRYQEVAITSATSSTTTITTIYMPEELIRVAHPCDSWSISLPLPKTVLPESLEPDLICTFRYDRDVDGRITDESPATVNVGATEVQKLGLHVLTEGNTTIEAQIIAEGFVAPDYPGEITQ